MRRTLLQLLTCVGCILALCDVGKNAVEDRQDGNDEAIAASKQAVIPFEDLLRVSESAAALNSHWRVELDSWHRAEKSWDSASASLPVSARGLSTCAAPLRVARGKLEEADELFRRAAAVSDPSTAAELLTEHENLQQQARAGLQKSEQCYTVLRAQVSLPRRDRPSPEYKTEFQSNGQRDPQSCRLLAEIEAIYREALGAPSITESKAWKQLDGKIHQLFGGRAHRSLMMDCHCPVVTAKRHLESMAQQLRIQAPNPDSAKNIRLAIQQDRDNVLRQLRGIENCVSNHCQGQQYPVAGQSAPPQTTCAPDPDPGTQRELRPSVEEALRTFVGMGRAADTMLTTMGKLTAARLEYLSHPNAINKQLYPYLSRPGALNQSALNAAGTVVDYFANEDSRARTNLELWNNARNATEWANQHGAEAVGAAADQILWGKFLGGGVQVCESSAAGLEVEIAKTKKALQRIRRTVEEQARTRPPSPGNNWCAVNPYLHNLNCFPASIAYDMRRETKYQWRADDFNWKKANVAPTWTDIDRLLRGLYGDRAYNGMLPWRQKDQLIGNMSTMLRRDMENELVTAGDGARGLVYVQWPQGGAHIFNVEVLNNRLRYWDAQSNFDGLRNFQQLNVPAGQEQVMFYRTAGPDMVRGKP